MRIPADSLLIEGENVAIE